MVTKLSAYSWVICCCFLLTGGVAAQQRTAPIGGSSQSIYLNPTASATRFTYFTTYDGSTTVFPLYQPLAGGNYLFSGELRPKIDSPGTYEADFASRNGSGWLEYGSFAVDIPAANSDLNGLPDLCQSNRAVNFVTTGVLNINSPFPTTDGVRSFTMARASNNLTGAYSFTRSSDPSLNQGTWSVINFGGSVSYIRSSSTITFNLSFNDPISGTRALTASTNYSVANANQIIVPQFSAIGGGQTLTFFSGLVLNRTGSRYIGAATVNDGIPDTYWPEATNWVVEINDPNDWDGNGIPDISDVIPISPILLLPPQSTNAVAGSTVSFTVSATGSIPLNYQWQFHGTNLPGATAALLSIANAQSYNAGDYRVIVSNGGGSITTAPPATLVVLFPPNITDDPMDVAVLLGDNAQFNVAANGSEPLSYQWLHAGTNLPGATAPILFIPSVQEINAGDYKAIVSNVAGTNVSATAHLTIATPPTISLQPKSQSVPTNANVTFSVLATGNPLPTYRWMRNGTNVPGGTASTLNLINVQTNSGGVFKVMVSSAAGNMLSSNATLYVGWPLTLTNVLLQPNGMFRTDLIGLPQSNYILQSSVNLSNWVSLATNSSPQGVVPFTDDPNGPTGPRRFYRAKVQ